MPRSHRILHKLFEQEPYKSKTAHFVPLPSISSEAPWNTIFFKELGSPVKLCMNAGDYVLWDSRTIHANMPPSPANNPESPKFNAIRRIVAFICMSPVSKVTDPQVFQQRKTAFQTGVTTSHWPTEYQPRGKSPSSFTPPQLSEEDLKLISPF